MTVVETEDRVRVIGNRAGSPLPAVELEKLWVSAYPSLIKRATWLTGSRDEALDLTQDIAVLALHQLRRAGFASEAEFLRWAHKRLRWLFLDRLRATKATLDIERLEDLPVQGPSQERSAMLKILLARGLKQLPDRQRAIVRRAIIGRTTREIADEFGITEATVRSSLRHARTRMAEHLQRMDVGEQGGSPNGTRS